ncbi:MFS transporter [Streptomyces sp. NPDC091217]|uniref:MFS transporter n=1 Tax=Streptomyces sp. NPDC091217 TaxID=3365975 RepID=UPI003829FD2E
MIGWRARLGVAGAPLAHRGFRLHFTARLLSWTGSAVAPLALAFAALGMGGGPRALGVVLAAGVVPQLALLPVGGVVADRLDRARVMVWSNLACALAEALAVVLLVRGAARVWELAVMAAVCGAAGAFFAPAADGAVAEVVPAGQRHTANALLKFGQNTGKMASPALGGALITAAGPAWAIGWDAVTFVASALLFARAGALPRTATSVTSFAVDLRQGWYEVRCRCWLGVLMGQAALIGPTWLAGYQLLGPLYGQRFLGGAGLWGLVVSAFAGGLIAGAALALVWRPSGAGVTVCAGTGALALPLAVIAARIPMAVLVAAALVAGAGLEVAVIVWASLLQEHIPGDRLCRTLAYSTLGQTLPVPVAYLLTGPAVESLGLRTTLAAAAVLITTAAVLPLAVPQVRALKVAPAGGAEPMPSARATV